LLTPHFKVVAVYGYVAEKKVFQAFLPFDYVDINARMIQEQPPGR